MGSISSSVYSQHVNLDSSSEENKTPRVSAHTGVERLSKHRAISSFKIELNEKVNCSSRAEWSLQTFFMGKLPRYVTIL